jgi:hypothetical protein
MKKRQPHIVAVGRNRYGKDAGIALLLPGTEPIIVIGPNAIGPKLVMQPISIIGRRTRRSAK